MLPRGLYSLSSYLLLYATCLSQVHGFPQGTGTASTVDPSGDITKGGVVPDPQSPPNDFFDVSDVDFNAPLVAPALVFEPFNRDQASLSTAAQVQPQKRAANTAWSIGVVQGISPTTMDDYVIFPSNVQAQLVMTFLQDAQKFAWQPGAANDAETGADKGYFRFTSDGLSLICIVRDTTNPGDPFRWEDFLHIVEYLLQKTATQIGVIATWAGLLKDSSGKPFVDIAMLPGIVDHQAAQDGGVVQPAGGMEIKSTDGPSAGLQVPSKITKIPLRHTDNFKMTIQRTQSKLDRRIMAGIIQLAASEVINDFRAEGNYQEFLAQFPDDNLARGLYPNAVFQFQANPGFQMPYQVMMQMMLTLVKIKRAKRWDRAPEGDTDGMAGVILDADDRVQGRWSVGDFLENVEDCAFRAPRRGSIWGCFLRFG